MNLVNRRALPQSLVNDEVSLTRWILKHSEQFRFCETVEVFDMAETVAIFLKRTYSFLESLAEILAYAHDFTDSAHLSPQLVLNSLELLERPARKLHNNITIPRRIRRTARSVLVECAVFPASYVSKGETCREFCRHKSNREARSL